MRRLPLMLLATVAACDLITEPDFPDGAVPLDPPARYRSWWTLTEHCSGRSGDFDAVRWYVLPGASVLPSGHHGYWYSRGNRIVLVEHRRLSGMLVRHEMLHAILGGLGGHDPEYFQDRCGGVVSCERECDAPGTRPQPPGASAPRIDPGELEVGLTVWPPDASRSRDSGWVSYIVTARNPRDEAVWVRLEPVEPGHPASPTFGHDGRGASNYTWVWDSLDAFGPGQLRRSTFDVRVWGDSSEVQGLYNSRRGATVQVRVAP